MRITVNEKVYSLSKGNMLLAVPGIFMALGSSDTDAEIISCSFSALITEKSLSGYGIFRINEALEKYILNAVNLTALNDKRALQLSRLNLEMLLTLLSGEMRSHEIFEFYSKSSENYQNVFTALSDNFDKSLSLCEISGLAGLSEPNLKAVVYKYCGLGVTALFNIIKIIKIMKVIELGGKLPKGSYAGFKDGAYFRKLFYEISGVKLR